MTGEHLKERTRQFALDVIDVSMTLGRDDFTEVARPQLLRAGTGVAANYRAACRSRSSREFASRLATVVEEADESELWLDLLMVRKYGAKGHVATARRSHRTPRDLRQISRDDPPKDPRAAKAAFASNPQFPNSPTPQIKKGGGDRPLFSCRAGLAYRFLPPFFFPPLAAFFAIAVVPPFTCCGARGCRLHRSVAAYRHADPREQRPRFVAGGGRRNEAADSVRRLSSRQTKKGAGSRRTLVAHFTTDVIATRSPRLARASVQLRVVFTEATVPNRWAEPIVTTQDVDYG
jgi:four helix bundle protein